MIRTQAELQLAHDLLEVAFHSLHVVELDGSQRFYFRGALDALKHMLNERDDGSFERMMTEAIKVIDTSAVEVKEVSGVR